MTSIISSKINAPTVELCGYFGSDIPNRREISPYAIKCQFEHSSIKTTCINKVLLHLCMCGSEVQTEVVMALI
jgi:hypothetical protein